MTAFDMTALAALIGMTFDEAIARLEVMGLPFGGWAGDEESYPELYVGEGYYSDERVDFEFDMDGIFCVITGIYPSDGWEE